MMALWRGKRFLVLAAAFVAVAVTVTALWVWRFHSYTPVAVALDIRAALRAHHAPRPAERFLELRYGPLTEPANRQKAFLDFFNVEHLEGLYRLVRLMPAEEKQTNIVATAEWIAQYRRGLSEEEKASLRAYLNSSSGRTTLQRATADYLKRDVVYRSDTAPVITELMATLAALEKP